MPILQKIKLTSRVVKELQPLRIGLKHYLYKTISNYTYKLRPARDWVILNCINLTQHFALTCH
jgi:hypothetical protein